MAQLCDDDPFGNVIYSYSRKQAIEDGVLVDVTTPAHEAGFLLPVAVTRAVWDKYIQVPEGVTAQDEAGRLWDVLSVLAFTIRLIRGTPEARSSTIRYMLSVRNSNTRPPETAVLKSVMGPGDAGEPVITIMLPDED